MKTLGVAYVVAGGCARSLSVGIDGGERTRSIWVGGRWIGSTNRWMGYLDK